MIGALLLLIAFDATIPCQGDMDCERDVHAAQAAVLTQPHPVKLDLNVTATDEPDGVHVHCLPHEETPEESVARLETELRMAKLKVIAKNMNAQHERKKARQAR